MKKILCLILLLGIVLARAEISRTNIDISVSQYGSAEVKEEFTIQADYETAKIFENMIEKKESTIKSWQALIPELEQHIKTLKEPSISAKKIADAQNKAEYKVWMDYTSTVFADIKSTEGRREVWQVQTILFEYYDISTKKFIVPEETFITLGFEDTRADISEPASDFFIINPKSIANGPYSQETGKVLFFINGPASAENFAIQYIIEKPISESFGVKNLYDFFLANPIYLAVLLILIVLTVAFRRQIFALLQDTFIVEENIIMPRDKK